MSQKDKNTLGFVLLMLVFGAAFMFINPLFRYSWSRIFMHDFLGMEWGQLPLPMAFSMNGMARIMPLTVMFFFWVAVTIWVFRDAESRGQNGLLWGLLVFVGNLLGMIIYLIVRSQTPTVMAQAPLPAGSLRCPSCEKPINGSYANCPYCGLSLGRECRSCGKSVDLDWRVCAYCGRQLES